MRNMRRRAHGIRHFGADPVRPADSLVVVGDCGAERDQLGEERLDAGVEGEDGGHFWGAVLVCVCGCVCVCLCVL